MRSKFERDGIGTRLSDKQFRKLLQTIKPFHVQSNVVQISSKKQLRKNCRQAEQTKKPRRRVPFRKNRSLLYASLVLLGAIGMAQFYSGDFRSASVSGAASKITQPFKTGFSITDGDTIKMYGESKVTRLVGFNTPETYKPQCTNELALGKKATERLKELLRSASEVEVEKVACACRLNTQGNSECNYGRSCGILRVDGQDVGPILISEGLAVKFQCGRIKCPETPKPRCG